MSSVITVVKKVTLDQVPDVKLVLDNLSEKVYEEEGQYLYLPLADYSDLFIRLLDVYQIRHYSPSPSF